MFTPPVALTPPVPFPLVIAQSSTREFVAPGVERSALRLRTNAGPLVIHIVAVDTHEPTARLGVVLAHDRLVSSGETVSSMAARTNAVAGVNADYFDIGNTNGPLNIVVQGGTLVRSPSSRVAFVVGKDRSVRFANVAFHGSVQYGAASVPLTGVNVWPPEGGASLMTPAYGPLKPNPTVAAVRVSPSGPNAQYRVTDAAAQTGTTENADATLAFGPAAAAIADPPPVGSTFDLRSTLDPPLEAIAEAAGGGPLLLADGQPVSDPNEPAPEERNVRFPVAGAGITPDGTLLLVAVDGRLPASSIGLTRPEFAALMQGLGATSAMAFDSGGSATLVARALGDDAPSVVNAPSDGVERPVADGVFVYSDAPLGPGPRLFARPAAALALPGAVLELRAAVIDAAGHRLRTVALPALSADPHIGEHREPVGAGDLRTTVQYRTVERLAALEIEPPRPNPEPGAVVELQAVGVDALGDPVALEGVQWSAAGGNLTPAGTAAVYRAGSADGQVLASAGGVRESIEVRVGHHEQALPLFDGDAAGGWRFTTAPSGAPGTLLFAGEAGAGGVLTLPFDLDSERAAYATGDFTLPGEPLAFGIDVLGDDSGVALRAAFVNRLGERHALTLVRSVDWDGWRRLVVALPPDLNPPVHLSALYVARLNQAPRRTTGSIGFRAPAVILAGNQ